MEYMNLEHPDITRCIATGYPYPEEDETVCDFSDEAYEESRELEMGDWE